MMEARRTAEMVHRLPALADDRALPVVAQQACVETFFTHVRSLVEFLEIKPTGKASDFSAQSITPGWTPDIDPTTKDRLIGYWRDASKHVVHFSMERAASYDDASESTLAVIADDVLAVWDQYARATKHPFAPLRAEFKMFPDQTDTD